MYMVKNRIIIGGIVALFVVIAGLTTWLVVRHKPYAPATQTVAPGSITTSTTSSPAGATPTTSTTPTPSATPTTSTKSTAGATPGSNQPSNSTPTPTPTSNPTPSLSPTPTSTAPTSYPTGTIVPLYTDPGDPSWATVIAAKNAHPTVPVIAIVNPNNGPGDSADSSYTSGIGELVAAGVKVIGYVYTSYAIRSAADVETDINRWRSWYPQLGGIFFDEQTSDAGNENYYKALSDYAKSQGLTYTVGNPGMDISSSYIGTMDTLLIYESEGVPSLGQLGGWHTSYDKNNFGIIPYNVSSIDNSFVQSARQYVGYIYLQSDNLPNPWDSVPGYFSALLGQLAQ